MEPGTDVSFQELMHEIDALRIPRKQIAEWAGVDASTVTRWFQGTMPSDTMEIVLKLAPEVQRVRQRMAGRLKSEVDSWGVIMTGIDSTIRTQAEGTGLFAPAYWVIVCWDPRSFSQNHYDVVIHRYFEGVWADMSHRIYNIGDQSQTVSLSGDDDPPKFDQEEPIGEHVRVKIRLAKGIGRSIARVHVQLFLDSFSFRDEVIGCIGGFGYRYRATKAIARRPSAEQSTDFLGAPVVLPCGRFRLLACIPKACTSGAPVALCSSNRTMLHLLMNLDNADPDEIEALLWPLGQQFSMTGKPDCFLKRVARPQGLLESLPSQLQESLKRPANLENPAESVWEIIGSPESQCIMLDLREPNTSFTHSIVWRLRDSDQETQVGGSD